MKFLESKTNRSAIVAVLVSILTLAAGVQRYAPDVLIRHALKSASRVDVVFFETEGAPATLAPIQSRIPSTIQRLRSAIKLGKAHRVPKKFTGYIMFFTEKESIAPEKIYFSLNPAYHLVSFEMLGKAQQRKLSVEGRKLLARYLYELKR